MVGNTLRRTLLRQDEHREPDWWDQLFFGGGDYPYIQGGPCGTTGDLLPTWQDLFRSYAPVAFRLRHRSCQVDKGKARSVVEVTAVTPMMQGAAAIKIRLQEDVGLCILWFLE